MAIPNSPFDPNTAIPNNPFFYPDQNYICGEYHPYILGCGFCIDYTNATLNICGGGTPAVSSLTAGSGIALSSSTGDITISNSGVVDISAGPGIAISNVGGSYVITNNCPGICLGTVTEINTGSGLTGGPITSSGTIALDSTSVSPGTYTNATITVDTFGRVTYAAPGTGGVSQILVTAPITSDGLNPPTLSISSSSLAAPGAVQLCDAINSTDTATAATPSAVKQAYDVAIAAGTNASNALTLAGSANTLATTANTTANSAYALATDACALAFTANTTANDAFDLATDACALAFTANTTANNALSAAGNAVPCSAFSALGDLLIGSGAATFSALPISGTTNGQVLTIDSSSPLGIKWAASSGGGTVTSVTAGAGLVPNVITTSGTIDLPGILPSATNISFIASLSADVYGRVTGYSSYAVPPILENALNTVGSILTKSSTATSPTALPTGPNGYVLTVDNTSDCGISWCPAGGVVGSPQATPTLLGLVYGSTISTNTVNAVSLGYQALLSGGGISCLSVAIGHQTLCAANGWFNTAVGAGAGCLITSGGRNTLIGGGSGVGISTGSFNTALGGSSLAPGNVPGNYITECYNTAIGWGAGSAFRTTSKNNVVVGANSACLVLGNSYIGIANTIVGACSASGAQGWFNLSLGYCNYSITTGCGNIQIGGITSAGVNSPALPSIGAGNDLISFGSTAVTTICAAVGITSISDGRDKIVRGPVPHGLAFVEKMEPKSFHFKSSREDETPNGPLRYGFIAQEVLALEEDNPVIISTMDEERLGMDPTNIIPILVNAIKELSAEVKDLKAKLEGDG